MNDVTDSLRDFFRYSKLQDIFLTIFETFLGLFAGGLLGALIAAENQNFWLWSGTIVSVSVFLLFSFNRLAKTVHFPLTAIDYLKAQRDLEKMTRELDRKSTINEYIDKAIESLNINTCPLSPEEVMRLCDDPLDTGLISLLHPIINLPHYILDCSKSKFTIAIHLTDYPLKAPVEVVRMGAPKLTFCPKTIVFRDDFNMAEYLTADILDDSDAQEIKYFIHSQSRATYNHFQLSEKVYEDSYTDFKLFCSPLPAVCDGASIGILYIFCDKSITKPDDLSNTLLIFGRILANWIDKYIGCVQNSPVSNE